MIDFHCIRIFHIYCELFAFCDINILTLKDFYTPVFRRDVLWYGDVRPGLRPSVRPVSVRQFSTLFSYIL